MRTTNSGAVPYTNEPKLLLYGFIGDLSVSKYSPSEEGKRIVEETIVKKRSSGCKCWSSSHLTPVKRKTAASSKMSASKTATRFRDSHAQESCRAHACGSAAANWIVSFAFDILTCTTFTFLRPSPFGRGTGGER